MENRFPMSDEIARAVGAPLELQVRPLPAGAVHLEITSCRRCPFMRADRHYTGDSFELCFDWKCTKNHDAIISNMDWNDKEPPIPKWCPLRPNEPSPPAAEGSPSGARG